MDCTTCRSLSRRGRFMILMLPQVFGACVPLYTFVFCCCGASPLVISGPLFSAGSFRAVSGRELLDMFLLFALATIVHLNRAMPGSVMHPWCIWVHCPVHALSILLGSLGVNQLAEREPA